MRTGSIVNNGPAVLLNIFIFKYRFFDLNRLPPQAAAKLVMCTEKEQIVQMGAQGLSLSLALPL